jgi:hypothetical protein
LYEQRTAFFTWQQHKPSHLPHRIPQKPEELQIFIAAAFIAIFQAAVLVLAHNVLPKIIIHHCQQNILNYSQTIFSRKLHDFRMIIINVYNIYIHNDTIL